MTWWLLVQNCYVQKELQKTSNHDARDLFCRSVASKAPSPLLQLPSFDTVNGVGIDTMHGVYLGVVKQLVGLWFNPKDSGQRQYCGNSVEKVYKRLLEIKPPSVMTRIPRSIQHHLNFLKGIKLIIIIIIIIIMCLFFIR